MNNNINLPFNIAEGEVFGFGSNEYGQVGCSDDPEVLSPQRIFSDPRSPYIEPTDPSISAKIVKLSVGPCHNFAFSEEGYIYTWGLGSYGQLGSGNMALKQSTPTSINGGNPDDDWLNQSHHNLAGTPGTPGNYLSGGSPGKTPTNSATGTGGIGNKLQDLGGVFPRHRVKKYLSNIVVNLWFDCSFILVSKNLNLLGPRIENNFL